MAAPGLLGEEGSRRRRDSVTMRGTNFTERFGSGAAASVIVNSTTSITATSPAGTTGRVEVVVDTRTRRERRDGQGPLHLRTPDGDRPEPGE